MLDFNGLAGVLDGSRVRQDTSSSDELLLGGQLSRRNLNIPKRVNVALVFSATPQTILRLLKVLMRGDCKC